MQLLARLCLGTTVLALSVPSGFAKIYPDDFLITPAAQQSSSSSFSSSSSTAPDENASSEPFFFASEIPDGKLTRAQFVDVIATRLYSADAHDECFADLILSNTVNYNLLFSDVSLDAPEATSICLGIRNGIAQGYSNGTFNTNGQITVAEAAAALAGIGGTPLRDSNHVAPREPWYQRFMDAMRAVDREFTMQPWEIMTGAHVKHSLCVLKRMTPALDPLGEFDTGC
ncbi:MAG: S-layer homology domain-containing protein [Candidatus Peribacteraceae bacterium]|nr:S-layer homology domain-containing protein [Candidatus Peribacteraceae bacterium]